MFYRPEPGQRTSRDVPPGASSSGELGAPAFVCVGGAPDKSCRHVSRKPRNTGLSVHLPSLRQSGLPIGHTRQEIPGQSRPGSAGGHPGPQSRAEDGWGWAGAGTWRMVTQPPYHDTAVRFRMTQTEGPGPPCPGPLRCWEGPACSAPAGAAGGKPGLGLVEAALPAARGTGVGVGPGSESPGTAGLRARSPRP